MPRSDSSRARERIPVTAQEAAGARGAAWIRDHLDAVYRYARRRLPAEDAEDVTQQAFQALFEAQGRGSPPDDAGAYLLGCARRRTADLFRRRARRPAAVRLPDGWEAFDTRALPPETLEATELRDLVHVALGFLGGADAAILRAHYRGGASAAEIAERLAVSVKAAEMRLRRARAAFLGHFRRVGRDWASSLSPEDDPRAEPATEEASP